MSDAVTTPARLVCVCLRDDAHDCVRARYGYKSTDWGLDDLECGCACHGREPFDFDEDDE